MPTNRPHYHPWHTAPTGRAMFKQRARHTRQAARQWSERRIGKGNFIVLACSDERCKPPLN